MLPSLAQVLERAGLPHLPTTISPQPQAQTLAQILFAIQRNNTTNHNHNNNNTQLDKIYSAAAELVPVRHFFCYGSLRPDDDSGQVWTQPFIRDMKCEKAVVSGAMLTFSGRYAAAHLGFPNHKVVGWLLSPHDTSTETWSHKLDHADSIEGFPHLYQRSLVLAHTPTPHTIEGGGGGENQQAKDGADFGQGEGVLAWMYHIKHEAGFVEIPGGDWLRRHEVLGRR